MNWYYYHTLAAYCHCSVRQTQREHNNYVHTEDHNLTPMLYNLYTQSILCDEIHMDPPYSNVCLSTIMCYFMPHVYVGICWDTVPYHCALSSTRAELLTTNNRCASLHIHSQGGGAGECVEEEGVVVQHSLHAEGLVEQQVGTVEGQPLPSPNSLPTDHMVSMSMHVALHHHLAMTTYHFLAETKHCIPSPCTYYVSVHVLSANKKGQELLSLEVSAGSSQEEGEGQGGGGE